MVCHTDADVVAKALKAVRQAEGHFVWAQLRDLSELFDQRRAAEPSTLVAGHVAPLAVTLNPKWNPAPDGALPFHGLNTI